MTFDSFFLYAMLVFKMQLHFGQTTYSVNDCLLSPARFSIFPMVAGIKEEACTVNSH